MSERHQQIWLNGDRYNEAYLYEPSTGRRLLFRTKGRTGRTAGHGQPLGRRFVAIYVEPDGTSITLQVGRARYPLDGSTHATAEVRAGGLYSTVTIARAGHRPIRLSQRSVARWIVRRTDPAHDDLDEMAEDFAMGIAGIVNSEEAQASYVTVKAPAAGPWHLLG